jgi:UDP-N-acetylglucosamine 1-carboxyvinyltransferase
VYVVSVCQALSRLTTIGGRKTTVIPQTLISDGLMESFVIEGGRPLTGIVRAAGNKNAALPIVAACLLTAESVTLRNVPAITDVETMLELVADLGVDVEHCGAGEVRIHAASVPKHELDEELCRRIRASILLAGPLLARVGEAIVPPPGGDVIGRRRLDTHIDAFERLGAEVHANRRYVMRTDGLVGGNLFLDEASVTGTENAVMAAVLARGETVIGNAASEPHVQDLCHFLVSLGADIEGIESNVLKIRGVEALHGGDWRICPDHIEVASFMGLGAITEGEIVIEGANPAHLSAIAPGFERLGMRWAVEGTSVRVPGRQELVIRDDLGSQIPKIEDGPWPAFPADLTSIALAVATQARGTILIFEKMFENRLFFVDKLVGMGARIILCDPHRAVVSGPAKLYGERLSSPDIRAGMAMLIASLCAEGRSTIGNVREIDRGYERIDERLRSLGASIERVEG